MCATFVANVPEVCTWSKLHEHETVVTTFNFAIDAVGISFLQANRPLENHTETKVYNSGKHHLYGYNSKYQMNASYPIATLASGLS